MSAAGRPLLSWFKRRQPRNVRRPVYHPYVMVDNVTRQSRRPQAEPGPGAMTRNRTTHVGKPACSAQLLSVSTGHAAETDPADLRLPGSWPMAGRVGVFVFTSKGDANPDEGSAEAGATCPFLGPRSVDSGHATCSGQKKRDGRPGVFFVFSL